MKRLRRIIFNALMVVSLLLCVAMKELPLVLAGHDLGFPLYFIVIAIVSYIVLLVIAVVWSKRPRSLSAEERAAAMGLCTSCRYNLAGNVSGICPECGTVAPAKTEK